MSIKRERSEIRWIEHGNPDCQDDTVVVLVRHGETLWNLQDRFQGQKDSPLTALGRFQAESVGRRLQAENVGEGFHVIISSDLGRAQETAEIIQTLVGQPPIVLDSTCRERNYGEWEGRTRDEAAGLCQNKADVIVYVSVNGIAVDAHPGVQLQPMIVQVHLDDKHSVDFTPGGGESRGAVQIRSQSFMLRLLRQYRGKKVIVVTHGCFMGECLKNIVGSTGELQGKRASFKVDNGCMCRLVLKADSEEWLVFTVNDRGHLLKLPGRRNDCFVCKHTYTDVLIGILLGAVMTVFVIAKL